MKGKVYVAHQFYTADLLRTNPDKIFIFGDNKLRTGKAGQACIRSESNTYGIPTKLFPSNGPGAFFSDKEDELELVKSSVEGLWNLYCEGTNIVFPKDGIGTCLADLKNRSPFIFELLNRTLLEDYGFNNGG